EQLNCWQSDGVTFVTLGEMAAEISLQAAPIPTRRLIRTTLPGRAGEVTASTDQTSSTARRSDIVADQPQ
ncbi:hypothetical protein ACQ7B2_01185, partial [Escherichia coli]